MLPAPVGVFGGTFDPIHFGHLRPALELKQQLGMARMLLIPSSVPPHRPQPQASSEQRLAMLQRAVESEPALEIDQRELRRSGPSYMVDTLASLRDELGDTPLCLCLGVDAFLDLPGWHRWEALFELAHIVVAHRPGWTLDEGEAAPPLRAQLAERLSERAEVISASSAGAILSWPVTPLAIAATAIREQVRRGQSARYLLPERVWDYILQQKLYR
ncbi:MAG: nicotinate-nucleotide adenylyltransferase [Pseudomonadota bacterium]